MNKYINFIKKIDRITPQNYSNVSSREKLVVYTMYFLEKNGIPLLFNYICIASFKLFPERFHFGEFKQYPHIEMLNRTILHLRPKENNYAEGSVRGGYKITALGYHIAEEVEQEIKGGRFKKGNIKIVKIDQVKKTPDNFISKIEKDKIFLSWKNGNKIDDMDIWGFFGVTPYTRIDYVKKHIKEIQDFSKQTKNKEVLRFIKYIDNKLKILI